MPVAKPHLEFHAVDMSAGWSTPPGAVHAPFKSNRGCLLLEIHYYG